MTKTSAIYKTYGGRRRNISYGAQATVDLLLDTDNHQYISKRTSKDATLLTNFFQAYKQASMRNDLDSKIQFNFMDEMITNIPAINFALGGNANNDAKESGGILFEEELLKMFKNFDSGEGAIVGTSTGYVTIDLGAKNLKSASNVAKRIIPELVGESVENEIEQVNKKIRNRLGEVDTYPYFYIQIGEKRAGKIDFKAGSEASTVFEINGKPTGPAQTVQDLLLHSSFSIKSYTGQGYIHLGHTDDKKAVSAITEYAAIKNSEAEGSIRGAGIYYVHHPEPWDKDIKKYGNEAITDLYKNYKIMQDIYALTGAGLRYDELKDLEAVDFLLVNSAWEDGKGSIHVYSVNELLSRLKVKGGYAVRTKGWTDK